MTTTTRLELELAQARMDAAREQERIVRSFANPMPPSSTREDRERVRRLLASAQIETEQALEGLARATEIRIGYLRCIPLWRLTDRERRDLEDLSPATNKSSL
jgi:hypothetical protein